MTIYFDGATYEPEHDRERLGAQLLRVRDTVVVGGWWTLAEIEEVTGDPQSSISARLRDLRKPRFGAIEIARRRRPGIPKRHGIHEYRYVGRITAPSPPPLPEPEMMPCPTCDGTGKIPV